jgi:hypothetical protein
LTENAALASRGLMLGFELSRSKPKARLGGRAGAIEAIERLRPEVKRL